MKLKVLILFFILNFGALALGSLFTTDGVNSNWYADLIKAPWEPPGWVFGAAWFSIMICFSFYMEKAVRIAGGRGIILLYIFQWILNVSWNPVFFKYHLTGAALVVISLLLITIIRFLAIAATRRQSLMIALILPYFIWLMIAISLNLYIVVKN